MINAVSWNPAGGAASAIFAEIDSTKAAINNSNIRYRIFMPLFPHLLFVKPRTAR
jgi:hypothetical protein